MIGQKIPNRKNVLTNNLVSANKLIPRWIAILKDTQTWEQNDPRYLEDCVTKTEDENDQALININYCYRVTCNESLGKSRTSQRHTTGNQKKQPTVV